MVEVKVKLDLTPLLKLSKGLQEQLRSPAARGPLRKGFKQMAVIYRAFAQERFDRLSKGGGGEWPPLSAATLRGRRKGRAKKIKKLYGAAKAAHAKKQAALQSIPAGAVSILRDTGLLFGALDPVFHNQPGALEQDIPFGVRVGFGGPGGHGRGATIADIARFHDQGAGRLPRRTLIVAPPQNVMERMATALQKALDQLVVETGAA